tara:strand:- start:322 stop:612 length:291 start_codon:yes stop_codon:yes gene_type:complete
MFAIISPPISVSEVPVPEDEQQETSPVYGGFETSAGTRPEWQLKLDEKMAKTNVAMMKNIPPLPPEKEDAGKAMAAKFLAKKNGNGNGNGKKKKRK